MFDTDQASRLAAGEVCLAVAWSGDVMAAVEKQARGLDVRYAIPKEGAPIWFDMMVVPVTAQNPQAAHRFMEFVLRPEIIARITSDVWYPNPNAAATPLVDPEILNHSSVYPPQEAMERLFPLRSRPGKEKRTIARAWRRLKIGL